jgi:hypothetical protein
VSLQPPPPQLLLFLLLPLICWSVNPLVTV